MCLSSSAQSLQDCTLTLHRELSPAHMQAVLHAALLLWTVTSARGAGRVVQLVTETSSPFVASDPHDPQYVVSLFNEERSPSKLPSSNLLRSMLMTDAAGQRYNCSIPSTPSLFESFDASDHQPPAQVSAPSRTPFELLDSLTGLCLYRQDGLWTYELCHKKHVRQFRQATLPGATDGVAVYKVPDGMPVGGLIEAVEAGDVNRALEELRLLLDGDVLDTAKGKEDFSCGQYDGDEQQVEAVLEDSSTSDHRMPYVSHTYSGGAECVLTGGPRTAEVRYTCASDVKDNVITSIKEFPSCNYVLVVSTPFLCKHPAFTPPVQDLRLVACLPIDEHGNAVIQELPGDVAALTDSTQAAAAGQSRVYQIESATSAPAPAAAAADAAESDQDTEGTEQWQQQSSADHDEL